MIQHFKDCNANYPEKIPSEKPQAVEVLNLDDGWEIHQCVDCGAFEIARESIKGEKTNE